MADDDDDLLTTGEAAREVGVSRATVARWIRLGLLPALHLPSGHARIRRLDVRQLVAKKREDVEVATDNDREVRG